MGHSVKVEKLFFPTLDTVLEKISDLVFSALPLTGPLVSEHLSRPPTRRQLLSHGCCQALHRFPPSYSSIWYFRSLTSWGPAAVTGAIEARAAGWWWSEPLPVELLEIPFQKQPTPALSLPRYHGGHCYLTRVPFLPQIQQRRLFLLDMVSLGI